MKTKDASFTNISKVERAITVLAGAVMLYKALSGEKKRIIPALTGASMIVRGAAGHCPVYDLVAKKAFA